MHPVDLIYFWAELTPARPAVVQPDMVVTYRAFADAIASVSRRVEQLGLDRNAPVAVCIESPAKLLTVSLALLHSGFPVAPISRGDLPYIQPAGIRNVIYETEGLMLSGGRNIRFDDSWLSPNNAVAKSAPAPHRPGQEGSLVFFTSGTTGRPKKIIHTSATQLQRLYASGLTGGADCTTILIMPGLSSGLGFNRACDALYKGCTMCAAASAESVATFAATFGVDLLIASPAQALGVTEFVENNPGYDLGSLRVVRITGSSISKDSVSRIQSALCRKVFIEYGSTEAGVIALAPYDAIRDIPGAAGVVAPWAELEIVDEAGKVLPRGEEGTIRCRTAFFSASFAANNPASAANPDETWWYPGDIGRLNERDVVIITGRIDDMINRGGVKVSAVALDEILSAFPGIIDAGVCSVPGEKGFHELWVGVVPERPVEVTALQRSIAASASLPMPIDRMFAVDEIPRTDLGKIRRNELREKLRRLDADQSDRQS